MKDFLTIYLNRLDVVPANNFDGILARINDSFGGDMVDKIEEIVYSPMRDGKDAELYDLVNTDPDLSVMMFCGVDGAFYRKLFRSIQKNKQYFGKEIIDVGCGNGTITCFLATLFPESHVTGIDIQESGVNVGRQLAEKLELTNVEFKHMDLRNVKEKYDTVFCSRVSHEYIGRAMEDVDFDEDNHRIADQFERMYTEYARKIKYMLKEGGCVVSVDSIFYTMGVLGLYKAFAKMNIAPELDTYLRLIYISLSMREALPFVCCRMGQTDVKKMESFFDELFTRETLQDENSSQGPFLN